MNHFFYYLDKYEFKKLMINKRFLFSRLFFITLHFKNSYLNFCIPTKYVNMKKFSQLLVLIILLSSLNLSASNIHRNDTIGKLDDITDIEILLKNLLDSMSTQDIVINTQDTIFVPKDSTTIFHKPIVVDSVKKMTVVLPKRRTAFTPMVVKTSLDSLYARKSNGTIHLPSKSEQSYDLYNRSLSFRDTMFFNPLFLPVVFTGRIEPSDSIFTLSNKDEKKKVFLISPELTFKPQLDRQSFADKVKRNYYLEYPNRIKISSTDLGAVTHTATDMEVIEKFNPFKELLSSQTSFSLEKPDVEGIKIGRVYWLKSGENSLQISQNYFSPNWHQGGTSNLNINSYHVFRVNYVKDKVRFNNMFEWRLSAYNAPDDTLRNYRIGDDLLRYYGDFGLDAYKKTWSYSTNLEAKTQMFSSHIPNKNELRAAFLSPLYINAGIGMKYDLDKKSETVRHRRVRLALSISPLSINYKYVGDKDMDVKRFGIPEGKTSLFDKGSTVTSLLTYNITRYVTWTSRIKYFTNYSKVESEFENTLNMSLSQFFSTRLYLHLRYDDGVPADSEFKYLQINEVVSFGLNFKW